MFLYLQLAKSLREQIEGGQLKPGDPIPSHRNLAARERMSLVTVQKSVALLVQEGWLRTDAIGTYVAGAPAASKPLADQVADLRAELADALRQIEELRALVADELIRDRAAMEECQPMPLITCHLCGRTGRTDSAPSPDLVAVCQRCSTKRMRTSLPSVQVAADDTQLKQIESFDSTVFVGPPYDPTQYPPDQYAAWLATEEDCRRQGQPTPTIYPGSQRRRCMNCSIVIAIGPRQQETLALLYREKVTYQVLCHLCMVHLHGRDTVASATVVDLNNPYQPEEGC